MTAEEAAALDLPCFTGPEGLTCLGDTGAIGLLDTHRRHRHARGTVRFRTVVDGLPSVAPPGGGNALGVTDVSVDSRGRLFATIGLGGDPSLRQAALGDDDLAAQLATLGRVDLRRGTVREVADLGDVEAETNPAGGTVDTNPYALVAGRRGHVVVDDLDIPSVDQLVAALTVYRGGLLVVSHDRAFLDRLRLDAVVRLTADGRLVREH